MRKIATGKTDQIWSALEQESHPLLNLGNKACVVYLEPIRYIVMYLCYIVLLNISLLEYRRVSNLTNDSTSLLGFGPVAQQSYL